MRHRTLITYIYLEYSFDVGAHGSWGSQTSSSNSQDDVTVSSPPTGTGGHASVMIITTNPTYSAVGNVHTREYEHWGASKMESEADTDSC